MTGHADASGRRAVAAGGTIGQAATGDFVTQVERATLLPVEALALGAATGPVRYLPERTAQFVGRERELALLDEAFDAPGGVVVHALHGLGGVGKSTLAAHWAAHRAAEFNPVWWITAESRDQLDAGLGALGRALHPTLVGTLPEDALRERTLQWLAAHDGWLLVLDNVCDPADIKELLGRTPNGRFLITTRRGATSWRGTARTLDLDVLQPPEAVELFTRIHDGPADGVEELCAELGCLPLAIDQAAAYCREAGITPRAYLGLLAQRPATLYAAGPEGGDAERTIARVWRVTLDRLADTPDAALLLQVIAWWAPDGIRREYLDVPDLSWDATEAIRRLAAHSMITLRDGTISVHRLVQAVARTPDEQDPYRGKARIADCRRIAVDLLFSALRRWRRGVVPDGFRSFLGTEGRDWATHVEALAARYPRAEDTERTANLFVGAGLRLGCDALYQRSLALCERASDAALRACGPADALTRHALDSLARACEATGDVDRALELRTRLVEDCARVLGPDHEDTIAARTKLADTLRDADRHEQALAVARENAREAERALGEAHPTTDTARAMLASLLASGAAGRPAVAIPGGTPTTGPGPGDPLEHLKGLEMLGQVLAAAQNGEHERAVVMVDMAVTRCRDDYGDAAAPTLLARACQVAVLRLAGRHERADELAPGVSEDAVRELGDTEYTRMLRSTVSGTPADNSPWP